MKTNTKKKMKNAARLSLALGFLGLMCSCSFVPVVKQNLRQPLEVVAPTTNGLYENGLDVNDVGDGLNIDVRSRFDFSEYGDYIVLDVSRVYYTVDTFYHLQEVDVASDLVASSYTSVTDLIDASVTSSWTLYLRRTNYSISFCCFTFIPNISSITVDLFTSDVTAYNNGFGYITYANKPYFYYSVYFPGGAPTEIRTHWIASFLATPFVEFMSGYTTGIGQQSQFVYTQSQYTKYGETRYNDGLRDGRAEVSGLYGFNDLAGAIVDVPIYLLSGLSVFSLWDTPIISIIITFVFVGVALFTLKKVLLR